MSHCDHEYAKLLSSFVTNANNTHEGKYDIASYLPCKLPTLLRSHCNANSNNVIIDAVISVLFVVIPLAR